MAYRRQILCVYNAGLASIYLKLLDEYIENIYGDMKMNDISRYSLYFYSGALYNVFLKWLEGGMQESPEEIARMVYMLMRKTR